MIDYATDMLLAYYPQIGVGLAVLAGGLAVLKKIAPKKTKIDDEIVEKADKTGVSKFLERFNPFRGK